MHGLSSIAATVLGASLLFSQSAVVAHSVKRNPINYISAVDAPCIHTPSHRVHSHSSFALTFYLHDKQQLIKLALEPNHDVIAEGATVQYLAPDGTVRGTEIIDRSEHRVFKGKAFVQKHNGAEWTNVGWARVMVHRDGETPIFEGAFLSEGDHHHIQTNFHYLQTRHRLDPLIPESDAEDMIVWRDSDITNDEYVQPEVRDISGQGSCSADGLRFNTRNGHPIFAPMPKRDTGFFGSISTKSIFRRQIDGTTSGNSGGVNLASTIGDSTGCPTTRKVALIGIATDCTYTNDLGNASATRSNVITQINLASVQFEDSFNITLGLQNLTISDAACPVTAAASAPWNIGCSNDVTIEDRLNLFSAWRGARNDSNAYWTLLSTCATDAAVGLAWLGQACLNTASTENTNETVSSANVVVRTSTEWQVIAHETGHTFGAVHDCTAQTCADNVTVTAQQCCPLSTTTCNADQQFIMNPSTGSGITKFSACTVGNICSAIGRNSVNTTCLTANKNVATISGSQCGNGIVESGEDCDCGGTNGCGNNTCCDPGTCKFTSNSVCDPSNEDCCTSSCQFASNGTVCRTSTGICDPQEVCSGTSATCPANVNSPDGTSCGNSSLSLSCASGQCTSRNAQCQSLMGSLAHDSSTYACDSDGCQISCASPAFGANTCYTMQQNFLDGTSCAGGGRCSNGVCRGSTVGNEVHEWVDNNKPLVIGLSAGIGGLLVLAILACCINTCRRRRRVKQMPPPPPPAYRQAYQDGGADLGYGFGGADIPMPPMSMNRRERNERWDQPPPMYNAPTVRYA